MASNINYENIDETFPIAGVDNSTQGFRDNFNTIKNSLSAARTEILQLQATAVLKSPIPVSGVLDNNLAGSEIYNAKLNRTLEKRSEIIVVPVSSSNPIDVYFTSGHYHSFVLNANILLQLNWGESYGTDQVKKMRVELVHAGDSNVYSVDVANTYFKKSSDWPAPLQLSQNEIIVLEFWTYLESGSLHPMNSPNTPVTYGRYLGKYS